MPYWAAAQLQPQRERLALHTLALAGYVTYLPRLRQHRVSHGRRIETTPALFPGYAFVLIELQWHAARWAPGVTRIVLDGAAPARVPDAVIAEIRSRERGGLVELPPRFKPGDR
jgi:transcription antitermination factor NusG